MITRRARSSTRDTVTMTACQQLALLLAQRTALAGGQAVAEVDTPNLGRVVFTKADMGQLQREIDRLTNLCNIENGLPPGTGGRKPYSFEAWP
jgi:hypothetical protein